MLRPHPPLLANGNISKIFFTSQKRVSIGKCGAVGYLLSFVLNTNPIPRTFALEKVKGTQFV